MQRIGPWTATLMLAALTPAQETELGAQAVMPSAEPTALQDIRNVRLGSSYVRDAVRTLTRELEWHDDLEDAADQAVAEGKPILWIQALGDLKGFA